MSEDNPHWLQWLTTDKSNSSQMSHPPCDTFQPSFSVTKRQTYKMFALRSNTSIRTYINDLREASHTTFTEVTFHATIRICTKHHRNGDS